MSAHDEIDLMLRESADRWRSQPLPMPSVDAELFDAAGSTTGHTRQLAAAAVVVVGVVVIAAAAVWTSIPNGSGIGQVASPTDQEPSPSSTTEPRESATISLPTSQPAAGPPTVEPTNLPDVVSEGDRVVAFGHLFESRTDARLCRRVEGWVPSDLGCFGNVFVPVRGVNIRAYPGQESTAPPGNEFTSPTWVTDHVRVDGVWVAGAVEAERVQLTGEHRSAEPPYSLPSDGPCEAPPGGWSRDESATADELEEAGRALGAELSANPDKYIGRWLAAIRDTDGTVVDAVTVVGVAADISSVEAKLRSAWPFDLCIVRVAYSASDLQRVIDSLASAHETWELYIDPSVDRVVVRLPVFDRAAAQDISAYSEMVDVQPIVTRQDD